MSEQAPKIVFPPAFPDQPYVTVSALDAGHLTLPEHLFITNADPEKRKTVPSMSFLIQHPQSSSSGPAATSRPMTMLFDLGIKRNISGYRTAQQDHIAQRQPVILSPDARESLIAGGMQPEDIDIVVLSHVHWDHVGTSFDFVNAQFVVGSGTLDVLENGDGPYYPADLFNSDELPLEQTHELPPVAGRNSAHRPRFGRETKHVWKEIQGLGPAVDFFGDGAVWVVDAPGHLTGHVNLLVRTGPRKWVYLGGDCCHDPRILHGESEIALYNDGKGALRSVHMDTEMARETIGRVSRLAKSAKEGKVVENGNEESSVEVEVVVAHDAEWRETNRGRFWPGCL